MRKAVRTVVYDEELRIEAYRLEGIVQPFPNHFHEYYVIGFVEDGARVLSCRHREYAVARGDVLLFNPGDSHACVQSDGGTLDYRGFNIAKGVMLELAEEVTGRRELPGFSRNVISDEAVACCLRPLHQMVMEGSGEFGREESLLLLARKKSQAGLTSIRQVCRGRHRRRGLRSSYTPSAAGRPPARPSARNAAGSPDR